MDRPGGIPTPLKPPPYIPNSTDVPPSFMSGCCTPGCRAVADGDDRVNPYPPGPVPFWLAESYRHYADRDFAEALACAGRAVALLPESPAAWMAKANALGELGRFGEAQECLVHITGIPPADAEGWFFRCLALLILQRPGDAEACIRGADPFRPAAEFWSRMAGVFDGFHAAGPAHACTLRERRSGGTRPEYLARDAALVNQKGKQDADPARRATLLVQALACQSAGDPLRALARFDELLAEIPDLSPVISSQGECWIALGDLPRAKDSFRKALAKNPQLTVAWTNLGNLLATEGDLAGGLSCLDEAQKLEPERQYIPFVRGILHAEFQVYDTALACMEQALALDPEWPEALLWKGVYRLCLGDAAGAETDLSRALTLCPSLAEGWWYKGDCLSRLGRHAEAAACYGEAENHKARLAVTGFAGRPADDLVDCGLLGFGGFGEVRRCYVPSRETMVAVKSAHPRAGPDPAGDALFAREAGIWVRLGRHKNIVGAIAVRTWRGRPALEIEYIPKNREGQVTLADHLRDGPPDLQQALAWASGICRGMEYARSQGLAAHRDLKPANILVGPDGNARVSDFGLAAFSRGGTDPGAGDPRKSCGSPGATTALAGCGTITHMAPEQFSGSGSFDERSDIYSLGVVLYELATGRLPFPLPRSAGRTPEERWRVWEQMRKCHTEEPVPPAASPLFPVILRCMAKDPAGRYPSFSAVRTALEEIPGSPATGPAPAVPPREDASSPRAGNETVPPDPAPPAAEPLADGMPEGLRSVLQQGSSLYRLGKYAEAVPYFAKAAVLHPRSRDAWVLQAQCYRHLGNLVDAERCLRAAIGIDAGDGPSWYNLGGIHLDRGEPAEALACFDRAANAGHSPGDTALAAGMCFLALKDMAGALERFRAAVRHDPQLRRAWNFCAFTLSKLGQYRDAAACFDGALGQFPDDPEIWTNRGLALARAGDVEEACRSLEKALLVRPGYAPAQDILERIKAGQGVP